MFKFKKYLVFVLVALAVAGAGFFVFKKNINDRSFLSEIAYDNDTIPTLMPIEPQSPKPTADKSGNANQGFQPEKKDIFSDQDLPKEINLKIPFTSQAPHQNWEFPYKEFCEEASVLMAASYAKNRPISGSDDADAKMLDIKDFEEKKFGFYEDTNAEETAVILREYFELSKVSVVENPTAKDIKTALAGGKAVIMPFAGRQLGNPYYQQPGPLYHMMVIKGYTKEGDFITNDPGTRRGADYIYSSDVIIKANHDWNNGDVDNGRKVMIVAG